jgi:hypothetical protein
MTWWQTMLLGVVGSFIGGFGAYLLFGWDEDQGFAHRDFWMLRGT